MPKWDTVAIVGVGLIGGSIGLALRERGMARKVIGIGRRESSLQEARDCGAVHETTTDLARGVSSADLVVLCTPVERIVDLARQVAQFITDDALITDAGSSKQAIVLALDNLPRGRFIGSHPMAGSEKTGPGEARADLFQDRVVIVTPTESTRDGDYTKVAEFWQDLGATVLRMTPAQHDQAVASVSHLPHLVAAALAIAVPQENFPLAAGGLRDTTRIAAGDAELWRQILLSNRENVLAALTSFEETLVQFKGVLSEADAAGLQRLLEQGKRKRDALGS